MLTGLILSGPWILIQWINWSNTKTCCLEVAHTLSLLASKKWLDHFIPAKKFLTLTSDRCINSEPVGHLAAPFKVNAATWGEGGWSASIWRPDDLPLYSRGPCWRASDLFEVFFIHHASYFDKALQCVQKVAQWHFPGEKESKPLGFAKT